MIGYSVAYELACRGVTVHVIDMRGPGGGATQASAGMLAPYIEGHDAALLRLGVQSLSMYDAFAARIEADAGTSIEYCRPGTLQVASTAVHAETLAQASGRLAALGVPHELLTGQQTRALESGLAANIQSGLRIPAHGYVHVGRLMSALTSAAVRRGVTSSLDTVTALEPGAGVVTVHASMPADVVIVAAGSWSAGLLPEASRPAAVRPIRGQSVELAFARRELSHVVWGDGCYLVPRQDGSMIIGATVEDVGFDESSTPAAIESLLARAEAVLPAVSSAQGRTVRVGLRPMTADELPLLGWSSTMRGVCVATGHYRNGILLAPLTARLVADLVVDVEDPDTRWARDLVAPARLAL